MKWFLPLQREDTDKIGELLYFPPNGTFNLMYYPYYGKKAQVRLGFKSQNNIALGFINSAFTNRLTNVSDRKHRFLCLKVSLDLFLAGELLSAFGCSQVP